MHKSILPVERFLFISIAMTILIAELTGMEWYLPDERSFSFVFEHYIGPLVPIFLITGVLSVMGKEDRKSHFKFELIYLTRIVIVMTLSIVIHFNLKLWSHLLNPNNFDFFYQQIDLQMSGVMALFNSLHEVLPDTLPGMSNPYHGFFVLMFVTSFTLHGLKNRQSGEIVLTAAVLMMVVGAASYSIAPALGPFIYEFHHDTGPTGGQKAMYGFYEVFVASNGQNYNPAFFSAGLAAMPSLHVANAVMFWYCAWRDIRWLSYAYVPVVLYIFVEAVALRWHYLLDLAIGVVLGWVCFQMACWMVAGIKTQSRLQPLAIAGIATDKV